MLCSGGVIGILWPVLPRVKADSTILPFMLHFLQSEARTGCESKGAAVAELDLDDLDRGVIAELQQDSRVSYAALGKQLGVSGMTAATRLNRLRSSGVLWCKALPNLQKLGLSTEVFGYVQTELA